MQTLHFSTRIDAARETVWHTMLDDATYREWTAAFNPGSHYRWNWEKDSKMLFLGPDPSTGKEGGMVSRIAEIRPYEFVSIQHLGIIADGVEDTTSETAKKWTPAFENYTLRDADGGTEVVINIDVEDDYADMFRDMWTDGLARIKQIAESK